MSAAEEDLDGPRLYALTAERIEHRRPEGFTIRVCLVDTAGEPHHVELSPEDLWELLSFATDD